MKTLALIQAQRLRTVNVHSSAYYEGEVSRCNAGLISVPVFRENHGMPRQRSLKQMKLLCFPLFGERRQEQPADAVTNDRGGP
ncbi:MAG TPA: hypothetical protein VF460_15085 [Burkholderiales bacterium]